ncbi:MAG: (2Fe-2S)-binding protein [Bacteriovoracaceae bacterium]|nr:(2Fe-2S)-binding protein [Bacteriovoracaceae bacterium]
MPKIRILPKDIVVDVDSEQDLFAQLKEKGIHINSTCGGCASCARCTITVVEGEENLNEIPFEEKQLLGNVFHITKERLACQTKASGPITIDISMHEQPKKTSVVKRRKKEEVTKIISERIEKSKEKRKERPKKLGGSRKPRAFDYKDDKEFQDE